MKAMHSEWVNEVLSEYVPSDSVFKMPLLEETIKTYVDGEHIRQIRTTRDMSTLPDKAKLEAVFKEDKIAYGCLLGLAVPVTRGWLLFINRNSILELDCGNRLRYFKLIEFDTEHGTGTGFEEIAKPMRTAAPTEADYCEGMNSAFEELLHAILVSPLCSDQIKLS